MEVILRNSGDKKKEKPIVVRTQCPEGLTDLGEYEVGNWAKIEGLISVDDMTLEKATFRLKWLLGQGYDTSTIRRKWNPRY